MWQSNTLWHDMTWHYMTWHNKTWWKMIWCDVMWFDIIWYKWYKWIQDDAKRNDMISHDMIWCDMEGYEVNRKQCFYNFFDKENGQHQICKWHVLVHASKWRYQVYNLYMSHHETIHSRHILQVTLSVSMHKYSADTAQICAECENNIKQSNKK